MRKLLWFFIGDIIHVHTIINRAEVDVEIASSLHVDTSFLLLGLHLYVPVQ